MKLAKKQVQRLINAALSAQKNAYCPYSRYRVGASALTESGRVYAGCNIENASYGLSLCAERVAIFNAVTRHQTLLKAVCVVGSSAKPCGACRQVMFEFSSKDTVLFMVDVDPASRRQNVTRTSVYKMLPSPFDPLVSGLLPANPKNLLRGRTSSARRKSKKRRTASRKGGKK